MHTGVPRTAAQAVYVNSKHHNERNFTVELKYALRFHCRCIVAPWSLPAQCRSTCPEGLSGDSGWFEPTTERLSNMQKFSRTVLQ